MCLKVGTCKYVGSLVKSHFTSKTVPGTVPKVFIWFKEKIFCLTSVPHKAVFAFFSKVEDTFQEGQEKEEQQEKEKIKAEDNAIEMSEDFDGQMHDADENEPGNLNQLEPCYFVPSHVIANAGCSK